MQDYLPPSSTKVKVIKYVNHIKKAVNFHTYFLKKLSFLLSQGALTRAISKNKLILNPIHSHQT